MNCNTAVFYDVENLISLFSTRSNKTLQLDEIHRRILDLDLVMGISVQRAYADWMLQVNRNLRSYVLQIGIEPVQIFNTNQNDKVKNAADVSLIIDAVELLAKHPEIENYVIASGDGIFAFLAKKLHEYGKRVIGCGFDRNTNLIFRNACDIFIPLDKADTALTAMVKNLNKGTIVSTPDLPEQTQTPIPPSYKKPVLDKPAQAAPPEIKIPNKLPKNKFSEILVQSDITVWKNARDHSGSLHVLKRMVNVLFDWANAEADLEISLFKAYVDHYLPNFRIGPYGFKRFGEFMRFLVSSSPYCLIETGGTVIRIARREAEKKEHQIEDLSGLLFTIGDGRVVKSLFDIEDGTAFSYSMENKAITTPTSTPTNTPTKKEQQEQPKKVDIVLEAPAEPEESPPESARMFIKNTFLRLSQDNNLSTSEIKRLTTTDYAQKTFGVKVPVMKELHTRTHLRDQRVVNGKIIYWKDEFRFNGKSYLIFKEWTDRQHRVKFENWLKKIAKTKG